MIRIQVIAGCYKNTQLLTNEVDKDKLLMMNFFFISMVVIKVLSADFLNS